MIFPQRNPDLQAWRFVSHLALLVGLSSRDKSDSSVYWAKQSLELISFTRWTCVVDD